MAARASLRRAAFGVGHGQRLVQGRGGLADVEGVDQQRVAVQGRGGARLPGQHQRAAAFGQHRAFLCHQVHAVPDRIDQQHIGHRAGGQRPGVVVLHLEDQRIPVRRAELRGDLRRDLPDPLGVGAVLGHRRPGRVGEGQVDHPAVPLGPGGEQFPVGVQAAHDVLGQLGPVDPDDQLPARRRSRQSASTCARTSSAPARARSAGASTPSGCTATSLTCPRCTTCPTEPSPPPARLTCAPRIAAQQSRNAAAHRPRVKADVVRAEHAVEHGLAGLGGQYPVVIGRRPGRVREVRDAEVGLGAAQLVPKQSRGQAEVIVLDQRADARRGRAARRRLVRHRSGERLVIGLVGPPVPAEFPAEPRLVRRVEQHVVDEPQDRVGHVVVGPVEGVRRDVEHPDRDVAGLPGFPGGGLLARGLAVRVAERRADPGRPRPRMPSRPAPRSPRRPGPRRRVGRSACRPGRTGTTPDHDWTRPEPVSS